MRGVMSMARTVAFLFAHQDDEFGVFASLEAAVAAKARVVCFYLTDGGFGGQSIARRNEESLAVMRRLGIPSENVFFLGQQVAIRDGALFRSLDIARDALNEVLHHFRDLDALYLPAWEGGHQDHDATHLLGVSIAATNGLLKHTFQFPLYNARGCPRPFFRVASPLPENGAVEKLALPWRTRIRYLRFCLSYPSQWRSWVGLLPFLIIDYLVAGAQRLQPVSIARVRTRPHPGQLLYERRNGVTYTDLCETFSEFIDSHAARPSCEPVCTADARP